MAVAAIPGIKFAPKIVTVPPAYVVLGKIDPDDEPVTPALVLLELVLFNDAVAFEALTLDETVETSPGIAMICKVFGWLLTNA